MLSKARLGPGLNQEPDTSSGVPTGVIGTQILGPSCLPAAHQKESGSEAEETGLEPLSLHWTRKPRQYLNLLHCIAHSFIFTG